MYDDVFFNKIATFANWNWLFVKRCHFNKKLSTNKAKFDGCGATLWAIKTLEQDDYFGAFDDSDDDFAKPVHLWIELKI